MSNTSSHLHLTKPLKSKQGWYRCQAYTEHARVNSNPAYLTILGVSFSQIVYPITFEIVPVDVGSGGENNTVSAAFLKDIIEDNFGQSLHLNMEGIGLSDVVVSSDNENGGGISAEISLTVPFLLNKTVANQAKTAAPQEENIRSILEEFEKDFMNTSINFEHNGITYETIPYSLFIHDLTYSCPLGQTLQYSNFLCSKFYFTYKALLKHTSPNLMCSKQLWLKAIIHC